MPVVAAAKEAVAKAARGEVGQFLDCYLEKMPDGERGQSRLQLYRLGKVPAYWHLWLAMNGVSQITGQACFTGPAYPIEKGPGNVWKIGNVISWR